MSEQRRGRGTQSVKLALETPKDPTIRAKFNTYRFADHKEKVIDLLKRVTRVSLETVKIVETMRSGSSAR